MEDILKRDFAERQTEIVARQPKVENGVSRKKALHRLLTEPLLHFVIIGLVIYVAADYIKERNDKNRYAINISDGDALRIASLWEKQYGTIPSKEQLEKLVDNYIREEVFYREGVAMELDKGDEVIRRRIAQKYEFLQEDRSIVDEPSEKELIAYFEKNAENYRVNEKISFTHVFFSPDKAGDAQAITRANQTRQELISGKIARAPDQGDRFPFSYDYSDVDEIQLKRLLGDSPLAKNAFSLAPNEWSSPLQSGYGYHLIFVTNKVPSVIPELAVVKDQLRIDYLEARRGEQNDGAYQDVLKQYSVTKPLIHELNP